MKKKLKIKLPDHIKTFLCTKKNILILLNGDVVKTFKPKLKLALLKKRETNYIYVTSIFINKVSGVDIKNLKTTQGTIISEIKHLLVESKVCLYTRLKFIGVGYRPVTEEKSVSRGFPVKLGFSHHVYCTLNNGIKAFYIKRNPRLTLFGNCSIKNLTQAVATLRKQKMPEPYKGKGILFFDEKIALKTGKRV